MAAEGPGGVAALGLPMVEAFEGATRGALDLRALGVGTGDARSPGAECEEALGHAAEEQIATGEIFAVAIQTCVEGFIE